MYRIKQILAYCALGFSALMAFTGVFMWFQEFDSFDLALSAVMAAYVLMNIDYLRLLGKQKNAQDDMAAHDALVHAQELEERMAQRNTDEKRARKALMDMEREEARLKRQKETEDPYMDMDYDELKELLMRRDSELQSMKNE